MPNSSIKRIAGKYATLLVLILTLIVALNDGTRDLFASPQGPQQGAHLPTVIHTDQEGAPLRIVSTFVEMPSPEKITVRVMMQNQSAKKIRALAIAAGTRLEFTNLSGAASVLLPSQFRLISISYVGDGWPQKVTVSVDFVEFDDGTTWGMDAGNSRDRLAGQRAGAKAERQRLRNLLKSKGRSALIDLLEVGPSDEPGAPDAAGHSVEWLDGYRNGVAATRHRARQALQTGNPNQVEIELDKAFDTSEGNR